MAETSAELARRGRMWPWLVVALLVLMATMMGVLLYVASGDPSHVIVEDYYDKAVRWEQTQAQLEQNRQLGWRVGMEFREVPAALLADSAGGRPNTLVVVTLADSAGHALDSLSVHLRAFFSARAGRVLQADLAPVEGGWGAPLRLGPPGIWEFQLEARRGGTVFTWTGTRELGQVR